MDDALTGLAEELAKGLTWWGKGGKTLVTVGSATLGCLALTISRVLAGSGGLGRVGLGEVLFSQINATTQTRIISSITGKNQCFTLLTSLGELSSHKTVYSIKKTKIFLCQD